MRQWSSLGQRCRSNSSVAILAQAILVQAILARTLPQPWEICGTPGRPKKAFSTVGGTPATELHQDIRVPDGEVQEEDRLPVEVATAAAAAGEVDKERLGKGKEEEAGKEKGKEEDRLPVNDGRLENG